MESLNEQLKDLVKSLTVGYGESHNHDHAEKVARNTALILSEMGDQVAPLTQKVSVEAVLTSAAWLHDVLDHKMVFDPEEYKQKEGAMRYFLAKHCTVQEVQLVFDIINNVSYSNEVKGLKKDLGEYEVLRNIVSDADKLEAIGKLGVLRCYQYQFEVHPEFSKEQVVKDMKQHCEDKLMLLYTDYIRTEPGKKLGANHHQVVLDFYNGVISLEQIIASETIATGA